MPGVALGQILAQAIGAAGLFWYLRSGRGRLRLVLRGVPIRRALFRDILKVGAVACLSPLQSVTTMLLMAGFVAQLGVLPLAGFAIGQRLEFLMSTVAFGIGLASVPMVGMAIGAGDVPRARRVAWTAAGVTASVLGVVGLVVALYPDLWVTIFTRDEQVLGYGRLFLHWAGPGFAFFGLGLTLYFASQGAGRMVGPVFAATMRLLLVAVAGSWLVAHGASAWQLFALSAAAMVVYGMSCAGALKLDRWGGALKRPLVVDAPRLQCSAALLDAHEGRLRLVAPAARPQPQRPRDQRLLHPGATRDFARFGLCILDDASGRRRLVASRPEARRERCRARSDSASRLRGGAFVTSAAITCVRWPRPPARRDRRLRGWPAKAG